MFLYKNSIVVIYFFVLVFVKDQANSDESIDDQYVVITINQGQLRGLQRQTTTGKTFYSFKGIPYTQPPLGSRRFKDPVPADSWTGIHNATADGNRCAQINALDGTTAGQEDCLFINVFTPSLLQDENKTHPVIIHIHGGGFSMGGTTEAEVNPEVFLRNDIVFVSMNYRLGIFGFLSLDIADVPGNAALKDQLLAIKWVHQNIRYFNGDIKNITLHGISAGSASVEYQMLNSKSKDLFHRAILQSGATLSSWARSRKNERVLDNLSKIIGSKNDPNEILKTLSNMTTKEILIAQNKTNDEEVIKAGYIFTPFIPVVEKEFPGVERFLKNDPIELFRSQDYLKIPALTTFCRDEGNIFPHFYGEKIIREIYDRKYANFMDFLNITNSEAVNSDLTKLYTSMNVSETSQVDEFLSDIMFVSGIYQSLKHFITDGARSYYAYMFNYIGDYILEIPGMPPAKGIPHAFDGAYLILPESFLSERDIAMKNYLTAIHTNFIKYGNPVPSANSTWSPITNDNFSILNIDGINNTMIPFPFADRMSYWNSFF